MPPKAKPPSPNRGTAPKLPAPFVGFDRFAPPGNPWTQALYSQSLFSFAAHYLATHPPTIRVPEPPHLWALFYSEVGRQGWGRFFVYTVLSQRDGPPEIGATVAPAEWRPDGWAAIIRAGAEARERVLTAARDKGVEHALAVKRRLGALDSQDLAAGGKGCQGAVVFIDNEDKVSKEGDSPNLLTKPTKVYYAALIGELKRVDPSRPELEPVRVGFYARPKITAQILPLPNANNLYIWNVWAELDIPRYNTDAHGRITVPFENKTINAVGYATDRRPGSRRLAMGLGRQWMICDDNRFPFPLNSPFPAITPQQKFDYDDCMVRDPGYPVASPRLGLCSNSNLVLQGFYDKADRAMKVAQCFPTDTMPTRLGSLIPLEPEAPLLLVPGTEGGIADYELFTIDSNSHLVVGGRPRHRDWMLSPPLLGDRQPPLRRNRAMAVVRFSPSEMHVFFVSRTHRLVVTRRGARGEWSDPAIMGETTFLHPFSTICAVVRGSASSDVFFQDRRGSLCTAWCPTGESPWPGPHHTALQDTPTLLLGTSLAAVSPSESYILVFGIGADLQLHFTYFTANVGWSGVRPVALANPGPRLCAHARISAFASQTRTDVFIATVTETDIPCVYSFRLNGGRWEFTQCVLHEPTPRPEGAKPEDVQAGVRTEDASGWVVNPYGDVWLGLYDGGYLHLFVAGAMAGRATALVRNVNREGTTWRKFVFERGGSMHVDEECFTETP